MAALLLKVDFCWKYGYIQKASTSTLCMWTQGGKSVTVVPEKVKNMDIKKPTADAPGNFMPLFAFFLILFNTSM